MTATQRLVFFVMRSRKRAARISYIKSSAVMTVRKTRVPFIKGSQWDFSKIVFCQKKSWSAANAETCAREFKTESRVITALLVHQGGSVVRSPQGQKGAKGP